MRLDAEIDRSALNRILHNLVGNAIKFTEEGEVVVSVEQEGVNARIEVRDTGVGIEQNFLPHLFEAFKQESAGLARQFEGSGLGLSITLRLVERLGGHIGVESVKGRGTTFSVVLPLFAPSEPAPSGDGHTAAPMLPAWRLPETGALS